MSYKCLAFAGQEDFLSNIVHLSNVGSMLGQRRRRWPNIKTALDQCLVWVISCNQFSGYINAVNLYSIGYCWPTLDLPRHARFEAEWFFNKFWSGMLDEMSVNHYLAKRGHSRLHSITSLNDCYWVCKICKCSVSNLTNMRHFHPLEVVGSAIQVKVRKN